MGRELELKVELKKSDIERLAAGLPLTGYEIGSSSSKKLRSIYFDTPGHSLHAAGITLRLRREDGAWLQTVKAGQKVTSGVSNPIEIEVPVAAEEPDIAKIADRKLKRIVEKAIKGTTLGPVFETVVRRTVRKIKAQGGSEIELAVDDGEVRAGKSRSQLREVELELKSGNVEGLLLAAEKILGGYDFKFSAGSKAERGYRLLLGDKEAATPKKARPASFKSNDACAQAFAGILCAISSQVLANRKAVLETEDPDAAHQLRIDLRRLRSALRALRPLMDGPSLRTFERSAQELGRSVAPLRNADVLISDIYGVMQIPAPETTGITALRDALIEHREAKRREVRAALGGPVWTKLELYLSLWPLTLDESGSPALERQIDKHARKVLRKSWKQCASYGQDINGLDEERRHDMRKALKQLRYQIEIFSPLFPNKAVDRFVGQLKALQNLFGYVNDAQMASRLIEVEKERQLGTDAARAAAYIVGRHDADAAHAWRGAGKAWKKLAGTPQFWN